MREGMLWDALNGDDWEPEAEDLMATRCSRCGRLKAWLDRICYCTATSAKDDTKASDRAA